MYINIYFLFATVRKMENSLKFGKKLRQTKKIKRFVNFKNNY